MENDPSRGQFVSGSAGRGLVYNTKVSIQGDYDPDIRYGVGEVYEWDDEEQVRRVRRPSADNIAWPNLAILPGTTAGRSDSRPIAAAMFEMDSRPVLVTVSDDSAAPAIGSTLGTVAGSWALKVGNTGFVCTGINIDEGSGGTRLVYVRPFSGSSAVAKNPLWFTISEQGTFGGKGVIFGGDTKEIRAYNDLQQAFKYRLSPVSRPGGTYDDGYDSLNDWDQSSASPHFRDGVGITSLQRYISNWPLINIRQSMATWNGEAISEMVELPLPLSITLSGSLPKISNPIVLSNGTFRFFRINGSSAPYTPQIWKYGTHSGSITGTLVTKLSTNQPIGQAYVTVTTANPGGALDLKVGNDIRIGSVTYTVSTAVAQPNAGQDVNVQLTSPLTVALIGGETVTLVSSWAVEKEAAAINTTSSIGATFSHIRCMRGFPSDYYFFMGSGSYKDTTSDNGIVGYKYQLSTGNLTPVPNRAILYPGYGYYVGEFQSSAGGIGGITVDGYVYALGTQYSVLGGTITSKTGLIKYTGSSWDYVDLQIPTGFTYTPTSAWSFPQTMIHTPDGRLIFAFGLNDIGSYKYCCFYIIESNKKPKLIYSGSIPFILRTRDTYPAHYVLWGCSKTGWDDGACGDLYLSATVRGLNQITKKPLNTITSDGCVPLYCGGLYRLSGGGDPESTITGTVTTKTGTTQTVGTTAVELTTGAASNCTLKAGNVIIIGIGYDERSYVIAADVTEANPNTDFTVNIEGGLEVELVGDEPVEISKGWASTVTPITADGIHQYAGGGTWSGNTELTRNMIPLR